MTLMLQIVVFICKMPFVLTHRLVNGSNEFVVDATQFAGKAAVVALFILLTLIMAIPQFLICSTLFTIFPTDCPIEIQTMSRTEARTQIFDSVWLKSKQTLEPWFERFFQTLFYHQAKTTFTEMAAKLVGSAVATAVGSGMRCFDIADDLFLGRNNVVDNLIKIIFDSGASTNLVFSPLKGDAILGERQLNLAAGGKSKGQITSSGEIVLPPDIVEKNQCREELVSMGRFAETCGGVNWEGAKCNLYTRTPEGR